MSGLYWPDGTQPATYDPPTPGAASSGLRSSSEYGMRENPVDGGYRLHAGIDLVGVAGGDICSPVDGTVTIAAYSGGYGNLVEVTADNGDRFRMAHNKSFAVHRGQRVTARQKVAEWDTTGNSTGTHCHFETIPAGHDTVDPRDYYHDHEPKEDRVKQYHYEDATARAGGRRLAPGAVSYLNTKSGAPATNASNIVGGVGPYSITLHVYAQGKPGDTVTVKLLWDDTKTDGPHSPHYEERLELGADGLLRHSFEFKKSVAAGFAVYAQVLADDDNAEEITLTVLDSDAYLFQAA